MRLHDFYVIAAGGIALPVAFCAALASGCTKAEPTKAAAIADTGPCREGSGFDQRHGTSCLCCHEEFGVAGSVAHDAGVSFVLVTDRDGRELEMVPTSFDNFFRHFKPTPPLRATIVFRDGERRSMTHGAPHGSCNACHGETTSLLGER